jgi:murein DD-endopeptidase MepM/ murein hydrolase activator NlpD
MTVGAATLLTALALITPALTGCDPAPPVPETTPSAPATPASPTAKTTPPSPTAKATPAAKALRYVFPVDGKVSYGRFHALYPAADILARCGAVARSPVDGVVLELSRVDKFVKAAPDGADKGGLFVSIRGADGVRYYSAHLSTVGATLRPGAEVKAGDPIGLVGRTGNANNICHVHFALSPPCASAGDWWNRRGVVYPWPYLDSWRQGGVRSPAAAVAAWQRKPGCGTQAPPS